MLYIYIPIFIKNILIFECIEHVCTCMYSVQRVMYTVLNCTMYTVLCLPTYIHIQVYVRN